MIENLREAQGLFRSGVLVMVAVAACAGPAFGRQGQATVRDSAGISIKDLPADATAPEWRLVGPTLTIGGAGTDVELYQVRGAALLGSSIAIANAGASEVLVVDETGVVRTTIGRSGEGPGEFRSLGYVDLLPPDSILTYDYRLGRFQVFDRARTVARTFQLKQTPENPLSFAPVGLLPDRRLVVRGLRRNGVSSSAVGVVRDTFDLIIYDLLGEPTGDVMATVPAWAAYNPTGRAGGVRYTNTPIPFGASTRLDVLDGRIVLSATAKNEIRLLTPDGSTRLIIRGAGTLGPAISDAEAAAIKQEIVDETPEPARASLKAVYDEMPLPQRRPAIRAVNVSEDSNLWVSSFPADSTAATPVRIFNRDGDLMATTHLPQGLWIYAVDRSRLVGLWRDELGVQSVRVYEIERGRAPARP